MDFLDPRGNTLAVRRIPAFFETFPVLLVDEAGEVRADVAFRRADARLSIESRGISASLRGGILGAQSFRAASLVKSLARKAQLGQLFTFASPSASAIDGVYASSRARLARWAIFVSRYLAGCPPLDKGRSRVWQV